MTTVDDLVALVEQYPTNPIIAAMLTDELMERDGLLRHEADLAVFKVASVGGAAQAIRTAVSLLADDQPSARYLLHLVRVTCHCPRRSRPSVIITDGAALNIRPTSSVTTADDYWGHVVILAGATWILQRWAERVEAVRLQRRARRIARRRR